MQSMNQLSLLRLHLNKKTKVTKKKKWMKKREVKKKASTNVIPKKKRIKQQIREMKNTKDPSFTSDYLVFISLNFIKKLKKFLVWSSNKLLVTSLLREIFTVVANCMLYYFQTLQSSYCLSSLPKQQRIVKEVVHMSQHLHMCICAYVYVLWNIFRHITAFEGVNRTSGYKH